MRCEPRNIVLKDGRSCMLRSAEAADAPAILDCLKQIFCEAPYLLRYPDEVKTTITDEENFITTHTDGPTSLLLAAFVDGALAGIISIDPVLATDKCRHRAALGISLKREYWGLGIAAGLMKAAIGQLCGMGYTQLELEVVSENRRAVRLYEGFGFRTCGTNPKGVRLRDGRYLPLQVMILDLEN